MEQSLWCVVLSGRDWDEVLSGVALSLKYTLFSWYPLLHMHVTHQLVAALRTRFTPVHILSINSSTSEDDNKCKSRWSHPWPFNCTYPKAQGNGEAETICRSVLANQFVADRLRQSWYDKHECLNSYWLKPASKKLTSCCVYRVSQECMIKRERKSVRLPPILDRRNNQPVLNLEC